MLGSILAQSYHQTMSPTLASLPAAARGAAGGSISATQAVAARLGPAGHFLLGPANDAFVTAMHVTTLVAAVIALAGALVVLRWMPGLSRPAADTAAADTAAADTAAAETVPELAPAGVEASFDVATEPFDVERHGSGPYRIDPIDALDVWQENLSARSPGGE